MSIKQFEDRTPYWGFKTAPELKYLQKIFSPKNAQISVTRECYVDILKIIYESYIQDESLRNTDFYYQKLRTLGQKYKISMHQLTVLYSSILKLFCATMKVSSLKQEIVEEDLLKILKLPQEFVSDFTGLVYHQKKREIIEINVAKNSVKSVHVKTISWRIDVSISTSSLSRTLEPSIVLQMHLSDDRIVSFEMNLSSFHLLRFNVALILKEIDDLLNRQIFKIAD